MRQKRREREEKVNMDKFYFKWRKKRKVTKTLNRIQDKNNTVSGLANKQTNKQTTV